jgi:hypothetical protein
LKVCQDFWGLHEYESQDFTPQSHTGTWDWTQDLLHGGQQENPTTPSWYAWRFANQNVRLMYIYHCPCPLKAQILPPDSS